MFRRGYKIIENYLLDLIVSFIDILDRIFLRREEDSSWSKIGRLEIKIVNIDIFEWFL